MTNEYLKALVSEIRILDETRNMAQVGVSCSIMCEMEEMMLRLVGLAIKYDMPPDDFKMMMSGYHGIFLVIEEFEHYAQEFGLNGRPLKKKR